MQRFLSALSIATMTAFFATAVLAAPPPEEKKEKKAKADKGEKKAKKEKKDKADKAEAKKPKDKKEIAKQAFADGKKAFDEEDYEGALEQFMLANDTLPNPFVYIKIAGCYEKMGNVPEAITWLEKYLEEKPDSANAKEVQDQLDGLKNKPGTVAAASTPEGAGLILDDEDTGQTTPAEIEAAPGPHTLVFKLEGYVDDSKTFEMTPGGSQEIAVELSQAEEEMISEEYPDEEIEGETEEEIPEGEEAVEPAKVNKGVWAAAGIAGAGIISATVFGILALNKEAEFEDEKDQGPDEGETYTEYRDRLDGIKGKGKGFAIACDVSWGVAAAATLAGIIVYYVTKPKPGKEKKVSNLSVAPLLSSKSTGAAVGFNF
jgi:tetratricopeptide (TPR) repeat protein